MSKQETSNTWSDGLVMDLNPLSTPNTVLTDNLNGTFLTYNGNEMSLQNDQGNYKLKYCKLPPNYLPVGVKEYADILYIVSYNPIEGRVEVGSYPSPLTYSATDDNPDPIVINSVLDGVSGEIVNHSDLQKNTKGVVFAEERYKLHPGDEYKLKIEDKSKYKIETIEYFILDEDSCSHNVTDKVKIDENEYKHVAWTIPGYLNIKPRVLELGVSGINTLYFYKPEGENARFSLNVRLNLQDRMFVNSELMDDFKKGKHLGLQVKITTASGKELYKTSSAGYSINHVGSDSGIEYGNYGWDEWYENNVILWKSISGELSGIDNKDVVIIEITPTLKDPNYNKCVVYDNLRQNLEFNLQDVDNVKFAISDELYKHYLNEDGTTQYIHFKVEGPKVTGFPVNFKMEITDSNGSIVAENNDYGGIGESLITVPFDEKFKAEGKYDVTFYFNNTSYKKRLYTSRVFNSFLESEETDFSKISDDVLVEKYWDYYIPNIDGSNLTYSGSGTSFDDWISNLTWEDKKHINELSTPFSTIHKISNKLSKELYRVRGKKFDVTGLVKINSSYLQGDLWKFSETCTDGTSIGNNSYRYAGNGYYGYQTKYQYERSSESFKFVENVKTLKNFGMYDRENVYLELELSANSGNNSFGMKSTLHVGNTSRVGKKVVLERTSGKGWKPSDTDASWKDWIKWKDNDNDVYINLWNVKANPSYDSYPILCKIRYIDAEYNYFNGDDYVGDFTWAGDETNRDRYFLYFQGKYNGVPIFIPIDTNEITAKDFYKKFINNTIIIDNNIEEMCFFELVPGDPEYIPKLTVPIFTKASVSLNASESSIIKTTNVEFDMEDSISTVDTFRKRFESEQKNRQKNDERLVELYQNAYENNITKGVIIPGLMNDSIIQSINATWSNGFIPEVTDWNDDVGNTVQWWKIGEELRTNKVYLCYGRGVDTGGRHLTELWSNAIQTWT